MRRSPDRRVGVIGINTPWRPIEDVALADGTCRDLPALIEGTADNGAAVREYLLLRNLTPTCSKQPRRPQQPDAISS